MPVNIQVWVPGFWTDLHTFISDSIYEVFVSTRESFFFGGVSCQNTLQGWRQCPRCNLFWQTADPPLSETAAKKSDLNASTPLQSFTDSLQAKSISGVKLLIRAKG